MLLDDSQRFSLGLKAQNDTWQNRLNMPSMAGKLSGMAAQQGSMMAQPELMANMAQEKRRKLEGFGMPDVEGMGSRKMQSGAMGRMGRGLF